MNMLQEGISLETISKLTHFSSLELETLKKKFD